MQNEIDLYITISYNPDGLLLVADPFSSEFCLFVTNSNHADLIAIDGLAGKYHPYQNWSSQNAYTSRQSMEITTVTLEWRSMIHILLFL